MLPSRTFIVLWYVWYLVKGAVNPNKPMVYQRNPSGGLYYQTGFVFGIIRTSNVPLETQPECVALTWKRCFHWHQWVSELFHFGTRLPRAGAAWDRARSPGHQHQHQSRSWCCSSTFCLKPASARSWEKSWRWRFQLLHPQNKESWTVVLKINSRIKKTTLKTTGHSCALTTFNLVALFWIYGAYNFITV